MANTHRGVIETSAPPTLALIVAGTREQCEEHLAAWVAKHPLGEFDEALIMEVK